MPRNLLISGVPATGKTWLGIWLAEQKGYVHIDAEKDNGADFDHAGIHKEWDDFLPTGRANHFIAAVERLGRPIVLNWGMPTKDLFVVTALQSEGVEAWWIRADGALARKAFVARENKKPQAKQIPVALFDQQMWEITRRWSLLDRIFGENFVEGLNPDGSQRLPAELWAEIERKR